jgi:DNA-binding NarL/FixJ family response regulator
MIRVVLADDQALVRDGFRALIDREADMTVVGEASDGAEAVRVSRQCAPDVVLMDIRMPGVDGLEATRQLLGGHDHLAARVLILTTFDQDDYVYEALRAGASGFVLKDLRQAELVAAIRTVAAGESLLAPSVTRRLIEQFCRRPTPSGSSLPPPLSGLTGREVDVLTLMARGLANAEIGKELFLSASTVKTHVGRILTKLAVRDRLQAVVLAYESGLVEPGITQEPRS